MPPKRRTAIRRGGADEDPRRPGTPDPAADDIAEYIAAQKERRALRALRKMNRPSRATRSERKARERARAAREREQRRTARAAAAERNASAVEDVLRQLLIDYLVVSSSGNEEEEERFDEDSAGDWLDDDPDHYQETLEHIDVDDVVRNLRRAPYRLTRAQIADAFEKLSEDEGYTMFDDYVEEHREPDTETSSEEPTSSSEEDTSSEEEDEPKGLGRRGGSIFGSLLNMGRKAVGAVGLVPRKIVERTVDVSKGIRRDFSPSIRQFLSRYGNLPMAAMFIRRDPIGGLLNGVINAITLGSWDSAKASNGFDKLFHLSMEVYIQPPNVDNRVRVLIEKNEVINITTTERKRSQDSQQIKVMLNSMKSNTINGMLNLARDAMGENFFLYDGFKNNCQDFIYHLLLDNGLLTPQLAKFVKQDVEAVAKQLPSYTAKVMNSITDLGGIVNVALQGQGGGWTPPARLGKQLAAAKVSATAYLKEARRKAKAAGLAWKHLGFSTDEKHKLQMPNAQGKVVRFGSAGLGDHILYTLSYAPDAEEHRRRYLARATKIKGEWKKDRYSPNSLAIEVLW